MVIGQKIIRTSAGDHAVIVKAAKGKSVDTANAEGKRVIASTTREIGASAGQAVIASAAICTNARVSARHQRVIAVIAI